MQITERTRAKLELSNVKKFKNFATQTLTYNMSSNVKNPEN